MDKIDQKIGEIINNACCHFVKSDEEQVHGAVIQIRQLFDPKPDQSGLLTEKDQDDCYPSPKQLEEYLAEPDDTVAASLTAEQKARIATSILYGRNIAIKQRDLTASIKGKECSEYANELRRDYEDGVKRAKDFVRAECQARIEALKQDESVDRLTYLGDEYRAKDGRPLVDEVVLSNATIHLESLSDQDFMLIVDNDKYHWHLVICAGSSRSKIYAVVMEEETKPPARRRKDETDTNTI